MKERGKRKKRAESLKKTTQGQGQKYGRNGSGGVERCNRQTSTLKFHQGATGEKVNISVSRKEGNCSKVESGAAEKRRPQEKRRRQLPRLNRR